MRLFLSVTIFFILGEISIANFDLRQLSDSENAIENLEDVLKSEERIKEFCYKHYDCQQRRCNSISTTGGSTSNVVYHNCLKLMENGHKTSGIYEIHVDTKEGSKKVKVYCDMETDGGGWLVIQRRGEFDEEHVKFTERKPEDYDMGFGNLSTEFWLGNENIHFLTNQEKVALLINLEDFEGNKKYAMYMVFEVADSKNSYSLKIDKYYGHAGDGMNVQYERKFEYYTRYWYSSSEFEYIYAGWWWGNYDNASSFLNGEYLKENYIGIPNGIWWDPWKGQHYSLKATEMKIKPNYYPSVLTAS